MKKAFIVALAFLLVFTDLAGGIGAVPQAAAAETPAITLNGTVQEGDAGYLDAKAITASAGSEVRINYRLRPDYAAGAASGVRVEIFLPSLEYVDGEYRVVGRDHEPTPMGLQGRVASDDTWTVVGDTTARGGSLVVEYNGDLGPGANPAFDLYLTTYSEDGDGPYSGVPEGTNFEINGYVSYDVFDRQEGTGWSTPEKLDDESRVSVITSDLTWEAQIEAYLPDGGSDAVPIWDRYQYADYLYTLTNTSENTASNIDGYTLSLDIDSTALQPAGIIPSDITRWVYREDGPPVRNDDPENTSDQFVGVPGEGGVLVYDVTHWDGVSPLTDPLPYSYSGQGAIMVDREHGERRDGLTPEGAEGDAERRFLISLPLSRQGFPTLPAQFRVSAVTNVLFAKTANWAKTDAVIREFHAPSYDFSFSHTPAGDQVVYGYETHTEITGLRNESNAPVFDAALSYRADADFKPGVIAYEVPEAQRAEYENAEVAYSYTDARTGETITARIGVTSVEPGDEAGTVRLLFDVSAVNDLAWDSTFSLGLADRLEPGQTLPVRIKVFGEAYRVGAMEAEATVTYTERFASNDDLDGETTYTDVEHEVAQGAGFEVIYPEEVVPGIEMSIDGQGESAAVPYEDRAVVDFRFGVNGTIAEDSTTTLHLNTVIERLTGAELTLREALFAQAENVRVSYETLTGSIGAVDLSGYEGSGDFTVELPAAVSKVVIDTDEFTSEGPQNFASVSAVVGNGTDRQHSIAADIRTYQPAPYDVHATDEVTGTLDIQLPTVDAVGVYGSTKTRQATQVGYESTFEVEYQLDTRDVPLSSSEYVIETLPHTGDGSLVFQSIVLQDPLLAHADGLAVTFVDADGTERSFTAADLGEDLREISAADVGLSDVERIIIAGGGIRFNGPGTIAVVTYDADISMGSSQSVRATIVEAGDRLGDGIALGNASNLISVRETQTDVALTGVNQVSENLGAGSRYSTSVPRSKYCSVGRTITDSTLDQGYKSLGGFTASFTRPTQAHLNNDQRTSIEVELPHEQFDLYYVKIREELRPYIDDVEVYRAEAGEERLWKTIPGGDWIDNSSEGSGFWRIGTARPGVDDERIFDTHDSVAGVADHPYYKDAWDPDSQPEAPVSRVVVNLEFERESNDAAPQLGGRNNDAIEYMGRFTSTSVDGARPTTLEAADVFGTRAELTRADDARVNSLVQYPFAQTRTGANDSTSLNSKVIVMGEVGEYLASIRNQATRGSTSYCASHGPDVYVPEHTNHDEWLNDYNPASFHDRLVYEFEYPASPTDDSVYNFDPTHVVIADTSVLPYLTGVRVIGADGEELAHEFSQAPAGAVRFDYDSTQPAGVHDDGDGTFTISFGEDGGYPETFEAIFEHVEGFGERTAEIDGVTGQTFGPVNEVDVRIGGVVNGNQALLGKTNIYRVPEDTGDRERMHTSSATLTGYTPRLGASLDLGFDRLKVYDYGADGVAPNTTRFSAGIANTAEADITDVRITVTPDQAFRSRLIEIPEDVFDSDWKFENVVLSQGGSDVTLDADAFRFNAASGHYELDLVPLFEDGTLETAEIDVAVGGDTTLLQRHLDSISVSFAPKDDNVRLWGSVSREASEDALPSRMRDGGSLFVTGVWVDEDGRGSNWNSKPSFVSERTKGRDETVRYDSTFTARAEVATDSPIYRSAGNGNQGERPALTARGGPDGTAPRLFNRVADLETSAVHLQHDYARADGTHLFYDADTGEQIDYTNIAVGDTARVLYELRNVGATAGGDDAPGNLPVRSPIAHLEAPLGLEITGVEATSAFAAEDANRAAMVAQSPNAPVDVADGDVRVTEHNTKRVDVAFDVTLDEAESVFFFVDYTATNDYGAGLGATQNRTVQWNAYARPDYAHRYMSYDSVGARSADSRVTGTTAQANYDGDGVIEHLSRVHNTNYRYANPNRLKLESSFDVENISGEKMTLAVSDIRNEIKHDNTELDVSLVFDTGGLAAFELTDFPAPGYPEGFDGEFAEPLVQFRDADGDWVDAADFDSAHHDMGEINELRVRYGTVPAAFEAPRFTVPGIGHWRAAGSQTVKSYVIPSEARSVLRHKNEAGEAVAEYVQTPRASQRVYKAIPQVEFNLQSFDTRAEAQADYDGADTGKTAYRPGDEMHVKLTAANYKNFEGTGTSTPYGKAPLLRPVIFDKIPEYLHVELLDYVEGGELDVAAAVAGGALQVRLTDEHGETRDVDAAQLPTATVETVTGADIAGAQVFAGDQPNNGYALLASAEPVNTRVNPAAEIGFDVVTYVFEERDLGRGERIEIIYAAQAREHDLPVARYADDSRYHGGAVFAPFFGWHASNTPDATSARDTTMDMAALLHDAGLSGTRQDEVTDAEFLSNSHAWHPGGTERRDRPTNDNVSLTTYYDASADTHRTHRAYLRENTTNDLYASFTSGSLDENFNLATRGRVEDGGVTSDATTGERILWAQDGMQLSRAWLYGASEMVPDTERQSWGSDAANFYEHDGSLNSNARHHSNYTPYREDDYSYAVQLHEQFTVRLHAANLGDHSIEGGLEYTEILPLGISPYDEHGDLLGVSAFAGGGAALPAELTEVEVLQTPERDEGFRAPAQSQEAGTYGTERRDDGVPYVIRVRVADELTGMFNTPGAAVHDKYQRVDIRVRVAEEVPPTADGISYWHDEFTLTTIAEEPYLEVYGAEYGAFDAGVDSLNRQGLQNDAIEQGIDIGRTLGWRYSYRTAHYAVEPWGMYIRGLNAQGTATALEDGRPAIVTGDRIAMRKPTLRVWSVPERDDEAVSGDYHRSIEDFTVGLYEEFTLHSAVENRQPAATPQYQRSPGGYNTRQYDDVWRNVPQTIGGARGSWFEPTVTIALPHGVAPVLADGSYGRYYDALEGSQPVDFSASLNTVNGHGEPALEREVTELFDVEVELLEGAGGKRYLLHFTADSAEFDEVAYGESLVISPRVVTIDAAQADSYQEAMTFANTQRPVFNPVISGSYATGTTPASGDVPTFGGGTIRTNDSRRPDSTSTWSGTAFGVEGVLKITERLISVTRGYDDRTDISLADGENWQHAGSAFVPPGLRSAHDKTGAYGGTVINLRQPSITNTTKVSSLADSDAHDLLRVDAAGKFWYSTEVDNSFDEHRNPYEQIKSTGDVHSSRFVITHRTTSFAEATGDVRLRVGGELYDRDEFEALGYSVERMKPEAEIAGDEHRRRVQWRVTPPSNDFGTRGELKSGESFALLAEMQLVSGYEDTDLSGGEAWSADELIVDSYVSLVSDDTTLIPEGAADAQDPRDFIVQPLTTMTYHAHESDEKAGVDIDGDGDTATVYAHDSAEIEILKPSAQVRVNTLRPRIAYSNGMSGDTYFNASETIDYLVTHAVNTGSGLKEFTVEHVLPTNETNDSAVSVSGEEISTNTRYVTTGAWVLPQATLERLAATGTDRDDAFRTYVYASHEQAEDGYEGGDWTLLNPGGTAIDTNQRIEIADVDGFAGGEVRKVRVVVKALDPDEHLVPRGLRLDIDADPDTEGRQSVLETDPDNHSIESYPSSVTDGAVTVGVQVSSAALSTLFVYDTVQVWGNYIIDRYTKLAQSETRSYLTPSRPVVDVVYDAKYYRYDRERESFGWSDNVAVAPTVSPHLKFSGNFINADQTMWSREEDDTYSEDLLMNPFVSFELPAVLSASGEPKYVAADEIDASHPLSGDHRSRYSLTGADTNLWTWRIEGADGGAPSPESQLAHADVHLGSWPGLDKNVLSVWFDGSIAPGDKVVVEFIGAVDGYAPGGDAGDLQSRAMLSNITGLLFPLNSQQNSSNRLGYTTDARDLNGNGRSTDRLVFAERSLFQYATFDNFGKRKISRSDLNRAGTVAPEMTPVRQGGDFEFEISIDNARPAGGAAYPYPIMYDVLPFSDDTEIMRETSERGSRYSALLNPDEMELKRTGADPKTYEDTEYTVYVGPFTEQNGEIVEADMVGHLDAGSQDFYDLLGEPGDASAVRDAHFVELDKLAGDAELLGAARTILVLFNDPAEGLPGQSQLSFTYRMTSPINAPVYLEQFDDEERRDEAALWNSFVATQRTRGFVPQESNRAGAYATEREDLVYLGNYVWNDVNYNGEQDEGDSFVDENGRTLLAPSQDLDHDGEIDDPGINGVRATLLTEKGYNVDAVGNPIHRVGSEWQVVDEETGESVLDEVFDEPILSEGPLTTLTETDYHGNAGYYTFSNIAPGEYRVMLEFPSDYDRFSPTTDQVLEETGVDVYGPGDVLDIPAEVDDDVLVTITDAALIDSGTTDDERMGFDIGVAHKVRVGGAVFEDDPLDGRRGADEPGLEGYRVTLKHMNGDTVRDERGEELVARTAADGSYAFDLLPLERDYYVEVTDANEDSGTGWVVSPIVHNADPFAEADDNDGATGRDGDAVRTNTLHFDVESLVRSQFADRLSVSVGFSERSETGVIGNRVWHDLNRDGGQDPNEPGVAGQRLRLEQYTRAGDSWARTAGFTRTTTSNADGYYYFDEVPSTVRGENGDPVETRYQVVVDEVPSGYTFTEPNSPLLLFAEPDEFDSDFYGNGTMHEGDEPGEHLIDLFATDPDTGASYAVDDNTADLGLVTHARSSLSGEIFIDADRDGLRNDAETPQEIYTASLEVRQGDTWVQVRQDADGRMIEPRNAVDSDAAMSLAGVVSYEFQQLHVIDSVERTPYEYRVRVTGIPRWQDTTELQVGDDTAVDSDFTHEGRSLYGSAVSDARVLGEQTPAGYLHPVETFTDAPAEHVDLGLFDRALQATIGDLIWHDLDGDGVQDDGEPGIDGLRVVLNRVVDGELLPVETTETGADGSYEFSADVAELDPASARFNEPHTYVVEFNLTSRQTLAPEYIGSDAAKDSDFMNLVVGGAAKYEHDIADPAHTAVSGEFALAEADSEGLARYETVESTDRIDGGVLVHDSIRVIGDTVYEDLDRDGVQADDEPGLAGVTVRVFKLNRETGLFEPYETADGTSSTVTDADGRYEFAVEVADLDKASPHYRAPEEYRVLVEAPAHMRLVEAGSRFSYQHGNDVDGIGIEKPYSFVLSETVDLIETAADGRLDLADAHDDLTVDAGFAVYDTSVTVGGRVWEDADLNGLQDDGEPGVAGRTVVLWELIGDDWVRVEDLDGVGETVTDDGGEYAFRVAPSSYDEHGDDFLVPREYRVTTEREGYQTWSPANVGDDPAIDSDVFPAAAEHKLPHRGVTRSFEIVDHENGLVDVTSVRDDRQMDIGLKTYEHRVLVGGQVWDDANEDGERQPGEPWFEGERVTLWELIDGEWETVEDLSGTSTRVTDERGDYEFEVLPTEYDVESPRYLEEREYRVTMEAPRGYLLSSGSLSAAVEDEFVATRSAQLILLGDAEIVDISAASDDLELDFPFVLDPEAGASGLAITGSGFNAISGALIPLAGAVLVLFGVRRRRDRDARGAQLLKEEA